MPSRLQAEIKQTKPFVSLEQEAILGLLRTAAIVNHSIDEVLRPFGLTGTQFNVLRILNGAGPEGLCGREVGERMLNRVPDVPRLLERLEKAELVSRIRDREDRRHVATRITAKGSQLLEEISHLSMPAEGWFKRLGPDQLTVLIETLDVIREG